FVFRINADDPHPAPWVRVKLSCAVGEALYPHPQWPRLAALWEAMYPRASLNANRRALFDALERTLPRFVACLAAHRPAALRGRSLAEVMPLRERDPQRLRD